MRTCSKCGLDKPLDEFPFRSDRPWARVGVCRDCRRSYARQHYLANTEYYKEKASRSRTRGRPTKRSDNYDNLIAYLRAHPCVDCGETDVRVLQFDHIDPATKSNNVSRMLPTYAWSSVLAEIAKCQVRCANCHRLKTLVERGLLPPRERMPVLNEAPMAYVA